MSAAVVRIGGPIADSVIAHPAAVDADLAALRSAARLGAHAYVAALLTIAGEWNSELAPEQLHRPSQLAHCESEALESTLTVRERVASGILDDGPVIPAHPLLAGDAGRGIAQAGRLSDVLIETSVNGHESSLSVAGSGAPTPDVPAMTLEGTPDTSSPLSGDVTGTSAGGVYQGTPPAPNGGRA